ncbi:UBN2_2 domain-containing protein [Cephalotus follicularis]|uniref:UBN2_2 domain-containing protein n=1 Tax=Cephalotus follicularis TaxID=3775 RepID=A0A1Q3AXA2_CEPFO|nr:UBN2_2 domain-containing protein [Cephalotus follicularis]
MHDDLIGTYEHCPTAKEMWDQLRFDFGGTSVTRLRSLVLKFEMYKNKNSMTQHLRIMSAMIRDLKNAGNVLSDEQQVQDVIRYLPDSWVSMRQILTHNENIKNFANVSRHVELEAEREEPTRATALLAQGGKRHGNWSKRKKKGKSGNKEGSSNQGPRDGRVSKRHRASVVERRTRKRSSAITVRKWVTSLVSVLSRSRYPFLPPLALFVYAHMY